MKKGVYSRPPDWDFFRTAKCKREHFRPLFFCKITNRKALTKCTIFIQKKVASAAEFFSFIFCSERKKNLLARDSEHQYSKKSKTTILIEKKL